MNDANCKVTFPGGCQECYQGYVVINGTCRIGNAFCRTLDNQGRCTSCYNGYALNNGNCSVSIVSSGSNNCANFSNGVCVRCSRGFYMANDGSCRLVSALCNTYNESYGYCTSCYPGYILVNGECSIAPQSTANLNCRNFSNGMCYECSNRFYSSNGICTPVNDYCNSYNVANGACLTCYQGFVLQDGLCYKILVMNTNAPTQTNSDWAQIQQ